MDEESTEEKDLAPEEVEVLELNLSISDDDLGGEEVEMAEQDGDLELPDPEAQNRKEQEKILTFLVRQRSKRERCH